MATLPFITHTRHTMVGESSRRRRGGKQRRATTARDISEERINKSSRLRRLRAVAVLRNTFDNYFHGNVSLERRSLNIKVRLSEDALDNFKVPRRLRREVPSLCFLQLVCFWLHRQGDDKDYGRGLHHQPVLCYLQLKDEEHDRSALALIQEQQHPDRDRRHSKVAGSPRAEVFYAPPTSAVSG